MSGLCEDPSRQRPKTRKVRSQWKAGRHAGSRHRGKPKMAYGEHDWVVNQPEDGVLILTDGSLLEVSPETDEMWDTHGYLQNWYNPCTRELYKGIRYPLDPIVDIDGPVVTFNEVCPQIRQAIRDSLPFLEDSFLDELALKSEEKLSSVVDMEVSIVNFLLEAVEACHGNVRIIKRFQKLYAKGLVEYGRAYKRFIAQGHRHAAASWLSWNFAIKPTLKDLRALLCMYSSVFRRLQWLRKHNHKVCYKSYRRDVSDKLVGFNPDQWLVTTDLCAITRADPDGSLPPNGLYQMRHRIVSAKMTYCAKSKFLLDLPDYLVDAGKGAGALWAAMNGITNPVAIVWEAIPFSWLIDYFLSERDRLFQRQYDFNPFNEGVKNCGYGHSFKIEVEVECEVWNTTHAYRHQFLGRVQYSLYSRRKGLPFPGQGQHFRLPWDLYHGSILTALTIGFLPHRRR